MKSICTWKKINKEGKKLVFEFVPRSPHRINHEKLLAYVKEHPEAYLREIAAHFSVGITTIWNALHRLGVKYKKTKILQRSRSKKAGCSLVYQPPYSPDLNPIEHFWSYLKKKIGALKQKFESIFDAIQFNMC